MKETSKFINVFVILLLLMAVGYELWRENWSGLFVVVLATLLALIPYFLRYFYNIHVPIGFRAGIVVFLFATLVLGEVNHFYDQYHWWDFFWHAIAGFGMTLLGFMLLHSIYKGSDLDSTPFMTTLFAFSFAALLATLWEVYEFIVDLTTVAEGMMQPSNEDTMMDIIAAIIGGAVVCIAGYRYLKKQDQNIVSRTVDEFEQESDITGLRN